MNMNDFGYGNEQNTERIELDGLTYVECTNLKGQKKTITDVVFYKKDDKDKAIIVFDDGTYTVTGGVAIMTKLMDIDGKLEDKAWDLTVDFVERTSKRTGRKYMDIF